jgi:hypothetical protein
MSEPGMAGPAHPAPLVQTYRDRLTTALADRGLVVKVLQREREGHGAPAGKQALALVVTNPGVTGIDAVGRAMNPGLGQQIVLEEWPERGLCWCWVWPAWRPAERGMPVPEPEIEPICPADDVDFAAARIANVVRLRDNDDSQAEQPPASLPHPLGEQQTGNRETCAYGQADIPPDPPEP